MQYQVPQLISEQLLACVSPLATQVHILDICCGTGLCAPLIKPVPGRLIAVDLSGKMLAKAAKLKLYDELHECELCDFMQRSRSRFQSVICADTFVYFGDLQQAFASVYEVLQPDGYFIFSLEQHQTSQEASPYLLQVSGRYSHHKAYVEQQLYSAGFRLCRMDDIVPRLESGKKVDGALFVAQKQASSA